MEYNDQYNIDIFRSLINLFLYEAILIDSIMKYKTHIIYQDGKINLYLEDFY